MIRPGRERAADWPERLDETLHAWGSVPGAWGSGDCGALACACLSAIGRDDLVPPAKLLARTSKTRALAVLRRIGGMSGWLAARCPVLPLAMAGRGDLIVVPKEHGAGGVEAIGVVNAGRVWMMSPETGLTSEPLSIVAALPGARVFGTG